MSTERKARICALLKGIETGDPDSVRVVDEGRYIQHNPQTHAGSDGLAALFKRISQSSPRVNIVRIFSDGDFVFGHTEYDFSTRRIGFEVFRFEGEYAVEHWDNIQPRRGPNPAGHSMVDGATDATDLEKTEANRELVRGFLDTCLIGGDFDALGRYVAVGYVEHNPTLGAGLPALQDALSACDADGGRRVQYELAHRLLAEGNFVLSVNEGRCEGVHTAFYDLFRLEDGRIVEHWDTTEAVPSRREWKNENGKF